MRHLTRTVTTVAAVAVLAACGSGTVATSVPSGSPSTPPTQTAVVTVAPTVSAPQVIPATSKKFGKASVAEAWKISTDLGTQFAYNPALMDKAPGQFTAADFAGIRKEMTGAARKDWDKAVNSMSKTSSDENVNGFAFHGLRSDGDTMNMANPVTGFTIDGSVSTSEGGMLTTTQRQVATIHMIGPKGKEKWTTTKTVHLFFKEVGGRWMIDGWEASGTNSAVVADR